MTLLAQHGWGKSDKITAALNDESISGLIVSPRDETPGNAKSLIESIASDHPSSTRLFDPLFHAGMITSANDGKLSEYDYYKANLTRRDFIGTAKYAGYAGDTLGFQYDLRVSSIVSPTIEVINFGDNVHAGTLPPEYFVKYVLGVYQRRSELLHAAGKFVHVHWDGNVRPLLPYARDTGLDGIEAITPQPQGDVTLEETKSALGDMWLLDGIPAIYFDHTFDEKTLTDCAKKVIDLFAPNLILGISDEISSHGDIERIRIVGRIVDDYNASL